MSIPVLLVLSCHYGQLLCQCAVKSLNQSITLSMEGWDVGLGSALLLTHGYKHTELEVHALVSVNYFRGSKSSEPSLHHCFHYGLHLLVWQAVCLSE